MDFDRELSPTYDSQLEGEVPRRQRADAIGRSRVRLAAFCTVFGQLTYSCSKRQVKRRPFNFSMIEDEEDGVIEEVDRSEVVGGETFLSREYTEVPSFSFTSFRRGGSDIESPMSMSMEKLEPEEPIYGGEIAEDFGLEEAEASVLKSEEEMSDETEDVESEPQIDAMEPPDIPQGADSAEPTVVHHRRPPVSADDVVFAALERVAVKQRAASKREMADSNAMDMFLAELRGVYKKYAKDRYREHNLRLAARESGNRKKALRELLLEVVQKKNTLRSENAKLRKEIREEEKSTGKLKFTSNFMYEMQNLARKASSEAIHL